MGRFTFLVGILALFPLSFSQNIVEIDVSGDVPGDGRWTFDCYRGYANSPSDFICNSEGGGVYFPPEDLNGERGFWTKCGTVCKIKYQVQPEDTNISFRLYQRGEPRAMISFDYETQFVTGQGWVEFSKELSESGIQEVTVTLEHYSVEDYTLLDKIVVIGEIPTTTTEPPTTTTSFSTSGVPSSTQSTTGGTTSTTTEGSSSSTTESSTSTTTEGSTSTTTTEGSTSSTTANSGSTSSTTEESGSTSPTTDNSGSTSPTTDNSGSTSSSTDNSGSTSSTTDNSGSFSSTTEDFDYTPTTTDSALPSTTNAPTSEPTGDTSSNPTSDFPSFPSSSNAPPQPCNDCAPESTNEKPSFMKSIWSVFLFSVLGILIFVLILICCIRYIFITKRQKRNKKDDRISILPTNNHSKQESDDIHEPYAFLDHYQPNKDIPSDSQYSLYYASSPRAIYRDDTPYIRFEPNRKPNNMENNENGDIFSKNVVDRKSTFVRVLPPDPPQRIQKGPYYAPSQRDHPGPSRPVWVIT